MAKEREGKGIKKKYCKLCLEKVAFVDYKDEKRLGRFVGSSRVDLQACKLEYSIVSPK